MRAKRKRQRRVIALSRHSDVYDPVDKLCQEISYDTWNCISTGGTEKLMGKR